jgi:hypothetical protein
VSYMLGNWVIGAEDVETTFLFRSHGDLLVWLQPPSKNQKMAGAFGAELSYKICDQNSALQDPVKISGKGFYHPPAQTSNLMARYNLSINF